MKRVLIPLADGFEEIETVTLVDVLRRAGLEVVVAGIRAGELRGSRRVRLVADTTLGEVKDQDFDMVVLPGGQPGVDHLRGNADVVEVVKRMQAKNRLIGAICAAPLVLRDAGLISGKKLTSYPSIKGELGTSCYQDRRVVVDQNMITSRAPGTAMEFALKLVEILCGGKKAKELSGIMLVSQG